MTVPTSEEIDAAIASIIANVPDERGAPDDLWWAYAYDPQGEIKGIGTGWTPAEARALAWISVWAEGDELWPRDWRTVPRHVPDGWYFSPSDEPQHYATLDGIPKLRNSSRVKHRIIRAVTAMGGRELTTGELISWVFLRKTKWDPVYYRRVREGARFFADPVGRGGGRGRPGGGEEPAEAKSATSD
jgi:hypothetical protein